MVAMSLSLTFAASSCSDGLAEEECPVDGGASALVFSCADALTKAEAEGEDEYNERLFTSIDVFFYPYGKTDGDAVAYKALVGLEENAKYSADISFAQDVISVLAGSNRRCVAYAIANLPEDVRTSFESLEGTSIDELKGIALKAGFSGLKDNKEAPASFVMDGQSEVMVVNTGKTQAATGTVDMSRVAAKLTFSVTAADHILLNEGQDDEQMWVPLFGTGKDGIDANLALAMMDVCDVATVGAEALGEDKIDVATDLFSYEYDRSTAKYNDVEHEHDVTLPFYSYPYEWEYGSLHESYAKVRMAWGKVAKGGYAKEDGGYKLAKDYKIDVQKTFYYKVFLPMQSFERNHWYDFTVSLGVLGSEADDESVEVASVYSVADWNEGKAESIKVGDVRYLNVAKGDMNGYGEYVIYNKDEFSLQYVTSHECEIVDVKAWQETFTDQSKYNDRGYAEGDQIVGADKWVSLDGDQIVLNHTLNNDIDDEGFDAGAYHITLTIRHKDDASYYETITIVQYPAIYVTAEKSNGSVWVNGYGCDTYTWKCTYQKYYIEQRGPSREKIVVCTHTHSGTGTTSDGSYACDGKHGCDDVAENQGGRPRPGYGGNKDKDYYYEQTGFEYSVNAFSDKGLVNKSNGDSRYLGTIENPSDVTGEDKDNVNQWLYTVHVTALQEGSQYFIADATEIVGGVYQIVKNTDDTYSYQYENGTSVYDSGKIASYRSTIEDAAYDNALSPEYMIGSSYGKSMPLCYPQAYARAAAYQESGYPMGRWRIPTFGEVKLAQRLSDFGKIPNLFSEFYWYASCGADYKHDFMRSGGCRPVYDKWYWGEDAVNDALTTPTWSDAD